MLSASYLFLICVSVASSDISLQLFSDWQATGDCWTSECNFCRNVECMVSYPKTAEGMKQVSVRSYLSKSTYNNIPLFDDQGMYLGSLRWSLRGFFLTGCMACRARRIPHSKDDPTSWSFTINGNKVIIQVRDRIVVDFTLSKKCAEKFKNTTYFGFQDMKCAKYQVVGGQVKGGRYEELQANHMCDNKNCSAGRFLNNAYECVPCEPNTYSLAGDNICTKCPPETFSQAESLSADYCNPEKPKTDPNVRPTWGPVLDELCKAGEFYNGTGGCKTCPEDSYSQLNGDVVTQCTPCPVGKIAPAGSTSLSDCVWRPCAAGFYMTSGGCRLCPENTFSLEGATECTKCPGNLFAPSGSTGLEDCGCEPGYVNMGDFCEVCPDNTYEDDGVCMECPEGTGSSEGSASISNCIVATCPAGSYKTDQGCEVCPANTYSEQDAEECSKCPLGTISLPGSSSPDACQAIGWEPTGNCWTRECGFCSSAQCGVVFPAKKTVVVSSELTRSGYNNIVLFDSEGNQLGSLRWNLRGYFLTGCIACRAYRVPRTKGEQDIWSVTFDGGKVIIQVGHKVILDFALSRKCAEHYRDIAGFGFNGMPCTKFQVVEEMEKGTMFQELQDRNVCWRR